MAEYASLEFQLLGLTADIIWHDWLTPISRLHIILLPISQLLKYRLGHSDKNHGENEARSLEKRSRIYFFCAKLENML